jgi:hydrogenase expression/formation protein HypD
MKYVDEFRNAEVAQRLVDDIRRRCTRRWVLMEVCGGQTHSLLRHGIDAALDDCIELIHGPGCPVCVTPTEAIDAAQELACRPHTILASFGDMLRVPGSRGSLQSTQSDGGRVAIVYSPLDAVELARRNPRDQVVFFAVGFETTTPATALAVQQAAHDRLDNFSLLVAHVCVLPIAACRRFSPPATSARSPDSRTTTNSPAGFVCPSSSPVSNRLTCWKEFWPVCANWKRAKRASRIAMSAVFARKEILPPDVWSGRCMPSAMLPGAVSA